MAYAVVLTHLRWPVQVRGGGEWAEERGQRDGKQQGFHGSYWISLTGRGKGETNPSKNVIPAEQHSAIRAKGDAD